MARLKPGLGKGIDALIPSEPKNKEKKTQVKEVVKEVIKEVVKEVPAETILKVTEIEPNRDQPRKKFDEEKINELADSIKQHGVIQPLVVQKKDDHYEIIAGERRWRAAKVANIKEVPVVIKDYSTQEVMEIALIENIQREDLNAIEEAKAYKNLIDEYSLKQEEVAKKVSKSRSQITNVLRLLNLPEQIQDMVIDQELSMGHARAILGLAKQEDMTEVAEKIILNKLSVRETEKLIKKYNANKPEKKTIISPEEEIIMDRIREQMELAVGSKVKISRKSGNKGKIEIEYYSNDDLERLMGLFASIQK